MDNYNTASVLISYFTLSLLIGFDATTFNYKSQHRATVKLHESINDSLAKSNYMIDQLLNLINF